MIKPIKLLFLGLVFFISSCSNGQSAKYSLEAGAFSEKLKTIPDAVLIDVRTADEFSGGHIQNAINIDRNGSSFEEQVAGFDKTKPVFVYCLSGGRSSSAASHMRANGFKEVYELKGGMMKWRAAGLPETTGNSPEKQGMSKTAFENLLETDKIVLVDFYADWCAPCKKMKPSLEQLSDELKNQLLLIRINVDENRRLCKELQIDELPVLQVYKNKSLTWSNKGFLEKKEIAKHLK